MEKPHLISCRHSPGFTLVEIMIVAAIIGILAALALPSFQKARINSQNSAFKNDLRIIEGAINAYILDKKGYPADVNEKIIPPELAPYLKNMDWSKPTPIGGYWDYDYNWGMTCGIGVLGASRTAAEMAELGNFVQFGGQYILVIVP
jgi:prepilin-type N-terminal cleavage/methylation domain-containing protein